MRHHPRPLRLDRVRRLEKPFGWVPFRLLTSGLLAEPSAEATLLYFFLCLVADRQGLSFWSAERLSRQLGLSPGTLALGRAELCERNLLAFDGWLYQVLSLPEGVSETPGSLMSSRSSTRPRAPAQREREEIADPDAVGQVLRRMRRRLGWGDDERE